PTLREPSKRASRPRRSPRKTPSQGALATKEPWTSAEPEHRSPRPRCSSMRLRKPRLRSPRATDSLECGLNLRDRGVKCRSARSEPHHFHAGKPRGIEVISPLNVKCGDTPLAARCRELARVV